MTVKSRRATILLCSVAVAVLATSAVARPVHHHRHRAATAAQTAIQPQQPVADRDMRYSFSANQAPAATQAAAMAGETPGRRGRHGRRDPATARAMAQSHANSGFGGMT